MRRLVLPTFPLMYFSWRICGFVAGVASASTTAAGATVAGGLFHTCVIVSDLTLRCFGGGSSDLVEQLAPAASGASSSGFGNFGQLGTGNNETLGDETGEMDHNLPVINIGNNSAQEVAAGQSHTCVLLTSGDVACWGFNAFGQLGLGDTSARGLSPDDMGGNLTLVDLGTNRTATHIACGQHHTCAVLDNGSLKCWGYNKHGMLGLGDTSDRGDSDGEMGDNLPAVDLGTGQTAVAVAGGRLHTCAILGSGGLKCWGGGNDTGHNYGQMGQGNTLDIGVAAGQMGDGLPEVDLGTGRTAAAVTVGWYHTCVILDNTKLHCFGRNFDGQLGLGDTDDRGSQAGDMGDGMVAVDLGTGKTPVSISAGRWHTCALLDDSSVKCFGVNTSDDLGAGQLGLGDMDNRGVSAATIGDGLESVELGTGRVASHLFSALDHNCVIFADATMKCWGLNASGQLGTGDTLDRGDAANEMGDFLPAVQAGMRIAFPPDLVTFDEEDLTLEEDDEEEGDGGMSTEMQIVVSFLGAAGGVFVIGAVCLYCRRRLEKQDGSTPSARNRTNSLINASGRSTVVGDRADELESGAGLNLFVEKPSTHRSQITDVGLVNVSQAEPERARQRVLSFPVKNGEDGGQDGRSESDAHSFQMSGREVGMAAAGTAGMVVAGGMAAGWNVIGLLAENLPWIGVAYHMLNEIADVVDTRNGMQGNLEKIKKWAMSLQAVLLQLAKQMEKRPTVNARALEHMSEDVMTTLQVLVDTVTSYNARGALAQYAASRSCQKAIDAADTALRGALAKLSVGQGAELLSMVGELQGVALVVDEKLDMIIEHLRKQEEHAARLELRLAEYSESMAEVLARFAKDNGNGNSNGKGQLNPAGKTLSELGREQLDKLQISKDAVSYPSNMPFASGAYSEVYQVIHEGVVKAAKKTNLARLGVGGKDVNRVFERFVKELYIMSQMHSDRVVSVYGAIASPTELTLVMEFLERGSLRTILDDDTQRSALTPAVQHGLLVDTAAGMTYLYNNGVEHRDLKSANCLVSHDWRVKISDFGLSNTNDAISTGSVSTMSTHFRGGTMVYMAPELLPGGAGREVPAELSDIYSFGVVVWDVVCGAGEAPWAGMRMNDLPLALKMGKRLDIPDKCGRFYRKLMLNCWREDPHRRPNFERVLHAVSKEADSTFSPVPSLSPPTYAPAGTTAAGAAAARRASLELTDAQLASSSSPETTRRTTSSTITREDPGHGHDWTPSGAGAGGDGGAGLPTGALEEWPESPQPSHQDSVPASNAGLFEEPVEVPRFSRRGSAPARTEGDRPQVRPPSAHEAKVSKGSPTPPYGSGTAITSTPQAETVETGRAAMPRRGSGMCDAAGRRTWPTSTSRGDPEELAGVRTPGRSLSRHRPAKSADSWTPSSRARSKSKHKASRSAEHLPRQDPQECRPTHRAAEGVVTGRDAIRTASMRAPSSSGRKGAAMAPPEPPLPEDRQFLSVSRSRAAVAIAGRATSGWRDDGEEGADLVEGTPYNPLTVGRTLSLASGMEAAVPASTDNPDPETSRSASLNMEAPRIVTVRSHESGQPQARTQFRRGRKDKASVRAVVRSDASQMTRVPDCTESEPVADSRELRYQAREPPPALDVCTPGRRRGDGSPGDRGRSRGGGNGARRGTPQGGGPTENGRGDGGRAGRRGGQEGAGTRHARPKRDRKVQVVHGFRLTTKEAEGGKV